MLTKFAYKRLTWIDLESPTKEEVREVMSSYDIHPLVAEELLTKTLRPKVDYYGNQIYLVLHFPTVTHSHQGKSSQEVDFVIGKNFLITVHYETVDPILEFSKMFEVNSILEKSNMGEHAGFLFFYIMRELYKNLTSELSVLSKTLGGIEERIFNGNEQMMVETISKVNRKLINFKQAIRFHKDVLDSFEVASRDLFGEKFAFYSRSITGEYYEVANMLEGHKETLNDLWNTNDSLLSTKTNEIMKTLSVLAAILLPVSLVVQFFGISSSNVPYMDNPNAFYIVIGIVAVAALFMYVVSKLKKWL
ncbi:MAG: magnesium transporter CorA family protein [Candidatus Paceibacterota bacterium]|jgi:magnesium transporter